MKLTVLTADTGKPVHLSVLGLELSLDGMPFGQELSFVDSLDGLSVVLRDPFDEGEREENGTQEDITEAEGISPAVEVKSGGTSLFPPVPQSAVLPPAVPAVPEVPSEDMLFQHLAGLHRQLSSEQGIPPYCIFTDKSLREMSEVCPKNLKEFGSIRGVGRSKLEKYGELFIGVISKYGQEGGAA